MRRIRWVLVGLAVVFAFAAAIRSARMHGTGPVERNDLAAGRAEAPPSAGAVQEDDPAVGRPAPEFPRRDAGAWINSPPLRMRDLRGQVVLLDVWSYG